MATQYKISPEAYTPVDEFQTVKFHLLSGLIGKTPTSIHLHPCPDISEFWIFFRGWAKANLLGQSIRAYLSEGCEDEVDSTTKKRIKVCEKIYKEYTTWKATHSLNSQLNNLPF